MEKRARLQQHLSLIRACAGWTSKDFGDRLGVSRQTISSFEKEGNELTAMQYMAIRYALDQETKKNGESYEMLSIVLDSVVDNPENYDASEKDEILSKARLMAPVIMKNPDERATVSKAWKAILAASGVVVSAALIAFLRKKD